MPDRSKEQADPASDADELFTGRVPILKALEKLRLRLLDLTLHTFDAEQSRLVKTYLKGLRPEPDREYLPLQMPPAAAPAKVAD